MDVKPDFSETSLIGEPLEVVLRDRVASFRDLYKYQCEPDDRFPPDWTLFATVPQEDSVSSGSTVEGWIFDIDENSQEITVTTDSFGRADLHSLKDRHIEAADHVAYIVLTDVSDSSEVNLDQVSHAKGLLSRCVRKDQWDWYTVYKLLGKPPEKQLHQGRQALSQLRDAAKEGDDRKVQQYIDQLRRNHIAKRFAYFVRRVNLGDEYEVIDDEYLLRKLHNLEPMVFEQFIADLWSQLGWETEVVPVEEDRGADVIATQEDLFTRRRAIQVKRKNPSSTHNLDEVQRYMALSLRDGIDEALLVTTGQFTQTAREEADVSSYELMDGRGLASFIRENELQQVVDQYVESPE
jgi:HJR/Mrr/RecB family endonuclease